MRPARSPAELGFQPADLERLEQALGRAEGARLFRRIQAVWLVAQGRPVTEAAAISALSRPAVYASLDRFLRRHDPDDLRDRARSGRPPSAPGLTSRLLLREVRRSPVEAGVASTVWTVPLLRTHLERRFGVAVSERTLRRRLHEAGLRWKRPRYVYAKKAGHLPQKKGAFFVA